MIKRSFDFLVALTITLILSPLLVPLMILLRLTGEGYIFYRQPRLGRNWQPFDILKFATMLKDSPNLPGGDITIGNDPRILPMGKFLRDTKLNELPQLFNVLMGDMSLVGPRPLTPRVLALFPAEHRARVGHLRPGITGIGSIVFRGEETLLRGVADRETTYAQVIAPYKAALEAWYADRQSLALDIWILIMTLVAIILPGVDVRNWFKGLPAEPVFAKTSAQP